MNEKLDGAQWAVDHLQSKLRDLNNHKSAWTLKDRSALSALLIQYQQIREDWQPPASTEPRCEVAGCTNAAELEGWYQVHDFAGLPAGLIQRRQVCEQHRTVLIGGQKEAEQERTG